MRPYAGDLRLAYLNPSAPDPRDFVSMAAARQRIFSELGAPEQQMVRTLLGDNMADWNGRQANFVFGLLEQRGTLLYMVDEHRRLLDHIHQQVPRMDMPSPAVFSHDLRLPLEHFNMAGLAGEASRQSFYTVPREVCREVTVDMQRVLSAFVPPMPPPNTAGMVCAACGEINHSVDSCPLVLMARI